MTDKATPNLPSRNFLVTAEFYEQLGFEVGFRDEGWMILHRGDVMLEFFPAPDLDPATSSFGCCLRLDDVDAFVRTCQMAGIAETTIGWPRLELPQQVAPGLRIGALLDPDCTLLRLVGTA